MYSPGCPATCFCLECKGSGGGEQQLLRLLKVRTPSSKSLIPCVNGFLMCALYRKNHSGRHN
jgi:hypothetical protein